MKAVVIRNAGPHASLELEEQPDPVPGPGEVLVRVRAAALNRADLSQRAGRYKQPSIARDGANVAGLEAAGEVVAVGSAVRRFRPGDRVMGQCSGAYAELTVIDERVLLPVPEVLDWPAAAATSIVFVTSHDAIVSNADLSRGETVLVQAAGSAVGLAAVQIARFLGAGRIFATVASKAQAELVHELGADVTIHHEQERFADVIDRETDGRGVDVIIDHVGGPVLDDNLRSLAITGRLVSVGRLGPVVGECDLDLLARNRLRLIGVSFRSRSLDEYGECVRRATDDLLPALADGRLRPVVDHVFPLERAAAAQERMAANLHLGKIVLAVAETSIESGG